MALVPPNTARGGYPLGLTGATAATRYVGATTSGAPASGTFAVGDFVIAQSGAVYVCTVAGSPGTWVAIGTGGAGTELAYVEFTSDVTVSATSAAAADTVVSAGAVTFDGATRVAVEFYSAAVQPGNNATVTITLWESSTDLGFYGSASESSGTTNNTVYSRRYLTPASGSKTYIVKAYRAVANGTIRGGAGGVGAWLPGYVRISVADAV